MNLRQTINVFFAIVILSIFCTTSQASETEPLMDGGAPVSPSVMVAQLDPVAEIAKRPDFALSYTFYVLDYKCNMDETLAWYRGLTPLQRASYEALYNQLVREKIESQDHIKNLYACFYLARDKEQVHNFDFPQEFLDLLSHMPAPEACVFFREMWNIIPIGSITDRTKWYRVVRQFLCQLPVKEQRLASLHTIMHLHRAESEVEVKTRLRKLRAALANGEPLNMEALKVIYGAEPTRLDAAKANTENFLNGAGEKAFNVFVGVPFAAYLLFSGQAFPH